MSKLKEAESIVARAEAIKERIRLLNRIHGSDQPLLIGVIERVYDGHKTFSERRLMEVSRDTFGPLLKGEMDRLMAEYKELTGEEA